MYKLNSRRRKYFLSKFLLAIAVSSICIVTAMAITIHGVTPDVVGPDGLPDGYIGFFADTYWNGRFYLQSANDNWYSSPPTWTAGELFSESVPTSISDTVPTFPLYATLDKYYNAYNNGWFDTTIRFQTTHLKFTLLQEYTIPAGMQMEFWVRINFLNISGYPQTSITGTDTTSVSRQTYTAAVFEYCLDDRWYRGDQDLTSYVTFDHYSSLINNDWVCYRSDISNIDRTISGIAFVPPVGEWAFLYQTAHSYSIDLSPVIVGPLEDYGEEPEVPSEDILGKLDEIINGTPDMDPDVSTPNYDDIRPDPDYDVGGLVGEDEAVSGLDQMQSDVDVLIGSDNFTQAAGFWQQLFEKIFGLAGASIMTSVSGVIIVIRAVLGR